MRTATKSLAAGLAAGVIGLGLIVPALAQDAPSGQATPDQTQTTQPPADQAPGDRPTRADHDAGFAAALATELGLDEPTVTDAIDAVRTDMRAAHDAAAKAALSDRLAAAVTAGELTQEQADAISAGVDAGVLPFGRGPGRGPGGPHGGHRGPDGPGPGA